MTSVNNRGSPIKLYKVHSGDTLSGIAAKNGTTVAALAKANHIPNPDKISTGQMIRFPDGFDSGKVGKSSGQGGYTVRAGDTLSAIAAKNGTTVAALAKANNIKDPNKISVGQQLTLSGGFAGVRAQATGHSFPAPGDTFETSKSKPPANKSVPSSTGTSGTTKSDDIKQIDGANSSTAHVEVPVFSQLESGHGYAEGGTACFAASKAMAAQAMHKSETKLKPHIQMATKEDANGRLTMNPTEAARGVKYVDTQLNNGNPVIVGVSDKVTHYNGDTLVDHFVVITGRGTDKNGTYYTFNDPNFPPHDKAQGSGSNPKNRLYLDPQTGKLSTKPVSANNRHYEVATVCPYQ